MSVGFRAVQWNRDKLVYDGLLLAVLALYVTVFLIVVARLEPPKDVLGEIDLRSPYRSFARVRRQSTRVPRPPMPALSCRRLPLSILDVSLPVPCSFHQRSSVRGCGEEEAGRAGLPSMRRPPIIRPPNTTR
jgi:hypothetical protein